VASHLRAACTSVFGRMIARQCAHSMPPQSRRAVATTALRDHARYTIATTMRHSLSTRMDIALRRSATRQRRRT